MLLSVSRSKLSLAGCILSAAVILAGCEIEPASYQYGFNITGLRFKLYSDEVGVHPNQDVLLDSNNPFVDYGVGSETKWDILASAGNAATFYAWATLLAQQPTGEHQFYTAIALRGIAESGEVSTEDTTRVRKLAIRGFQSVLDNFPESVTFDASGEQSFRLATFAFNEIIALGGKVEGDWILVATPNGGTAAVRSAAIDPSRASGEDD